MLLAVRVRHSKLALFGFVLASATLVMGECDGGGGRWE